MPSIFTLTGSDEGAPRKRRARKRKAKTGEACQLGECKDVFNGRTKKTISLCCVGKGNGPGQTRSGWMFKRKRG